MPDEPKPTNTQDLAETEYDAERWARVGTEQRSVPPISPTAPSDPGDSPEADLTNKERDAGQRAGQKQLDEDGLPSV